MVFELMSTSLPPPQNIDDINALTENQLTAYADGYYYAIRPPHQVQQRREGVARAIGYRGEYSRVFAF
jgi:hypothetical protein